jgi:acetyl esterase/lipase
MPRLSLALCVACVLFSSQLEAGTAYHDSIFGVSTTTDIIYGTGATNNGAGTANLLLDLYRPTNIGQGAVPASSPALVLIHGGGFTSGSKNDLAQAAATFASYGYTVASINYRLAGTNPPLEPGPGANLTPPSPPYGTLPFPQGISAVNAAVADATKAMLWMRSNAAAYGVDPNRIGIGGASAGAVTALLQAYNDPVAAAAPKVVLSYLGSMYGSQNSIENGDAPAFIVAGAIDDVVPTSGSTDAANRMNAVGVYNELYIQPGIGHDVNFFQIFDGKPLLLHNIEFLATYLVPEPASWLLGTLAMFALVAVARRGRLRQPAR